MSQFTNKDFIKFLDDFDDYVCSITEISKPKNKSNSLVYDSFKMFSFDDMCKKYPIIKNNLPKTMDAIHYEIIDGKLTLYIIEFKTFNIEGTKSTYSILEALNISLKKKNKRTIDVYSDEKIISDKFLKNFELIKSHFIDSIETDLILKPIETLFVALPWLYEEYCKDKSIIKKDFRNYLQNINIKLIIFVNRYAPNDNVSGDRLSAHAIDNKLKTVYNRLYLSNIIVEDDERIMPSHKFRYFIKKEKLTEKY